MVVPLVGTSWIPTICDLKSPGSLGEKPAYSQWPKTSPNFLTSALDDGARAWQLTSASHGSNVPETVRYDTLSSLSWDLITHDCFFTPLHHDSDGQSTYTYVRCGTKIWCGVAPRVPSPLTRDEYMKLHQKMGGTPESSEIDAVADCFLIFLRPGSVL